MKASVWSVSGVSPSGEKVETKAVFCSPPQEISEQEATLVRYFQGKRELSGRVQEVDWISNSWILERERIIKPMMDREGSR
jgi:hypothetical protein